MRVAQPPGAVARIEQADRDPHLSTLRRYAHAIGAMVSHRVELDAVPKTFTPATRTKIRHVSASGPEID